MLLLEWFPWDHLDCALNCCVSLHGLMSKRLDEARKILYLITSQCAEIILNEIASTFNGAFPCWKSIFQRSMIDFYAKYSRLSNKRRVWNNRIGWAFVSRKINVWYGITVLGGKNPKINKRIGWNNITECKFWTNFCVKFCILEEK